MMLFALASWQDLTLKRQLYADFEGELNNAKHLREGAPFDMLLHHANLAPRQMAVAVPDAPFVTIVREPADVFVSAWDCASRGVPVTKTKRTEARRTSSRGSQCGVHVQTTTAGKMHSLPPSTCQPTNLASGPTPLSTSEEA